MSFGRRPGWWAGGLVVTGTAATSGMGFAAGEAAVLNVFVKRRFMAAESSVRSRRAYV